MFGKKNTHFYVTFVIQIEYKKCPNIHILFLYGSDFYANYNDNDKSGLNCLTYPEHNIIIDVMIRDII